MRVTWVFVLGFILATTILFASEDPYKGWTTNQLTAEITKLKKQVANLQAKALGDYSTEPTPSGADGVTKIDDFERDSPSFGTSWWEGCDQYNMGTTIVPDPYERLKGGAPKSPGYCAGMKGHLGPNEEPWAWANLSITLGQNEAPTDLTAYKAIRFYTIGDGKSHVISLKKAIVKDYADYEANFTAPKKWTQVTILFSQFAQPNWGAQVPKVFDDVKQIAFTPGLHDADYDFKIDDLELLK